MEILPALLYRMKTESFWPDKLRVWFVILDNSRVMEGSDVRIAELRMNVPLTRAAIAALSGLESSRVRRAVAALEAGGYVRRASLRRDGELTRGKVVIRVMTDCVTAPPDPSV